MLERRQIESASNLKAERQKDRALDSAMNCLCHVIRIIFAFEMKPFVTMIISALSL